MYKLNSSTKMSDKKEFTITKKIAKHGSQAIIVIPKVLQRQIKPSMLVKIIINVLDDEEEK